MKPIVYQYDMDLRFNDLDSYGHLNSSSYLELVSTSRLLFMERKMGLPLSEFSKRHIGFFMNKVTQEFLRPITGLQTLKISSHIERMEGNGSTVIVPYQIHSQDGAKLYARGEIEYTSVDLRTGKRTPLPQEEMKYFFDLSAS